MQIEVIVNSASALKNVNWRFGMLTPYAVVWIDTSRKFSTKVDVINGMNPVWNEKFTIPLPPTSFPETAILYIDIVHANAPVGTKPLVGSVRCPLSQAINEAKAHGQVARCLNLTRPSGRPQGVVGTKIRVKDLNIGHLNQYNQQPTPYKQQMPAQPVHQVQMQPQPLFQPRPQVQLQGQLQPRPLFQPQGPYPPQKQPKVQPQGQVQTRLVIQPQGQVQPRPVIQPHGQYQPRSVVQTQIQNQQQTQVQVPGQYQPQPQPKQQPKLQQQVPVPQVQPMKKHPNDKLQQLVPQVQPVKKHPNMPAPVNTPNLKGPIMPTPAQGPRNSKPAAANRPAPRPVNPVQVQEQYNPAFGMGPRANGIGRSRAMPIAQNQNLQQSANNANSNNAAPGAGGENDNGQTISDPSAVNTVDDSNAVQVDQTNSGETFNDAESIQLSYDETQCISEGTDNRGYDFCEYATTEYDSVGNKNAGVECDNGGYYANASNGDYNESAGVGCDTGGYDVNAGAECDNGGYDGNAGAECDNGGYDGNAGVECDNGGYDANAGVECDNGVHETGDYVNGGFDGAELDSYDCEEVEA